MLFRSACGCSFSLLLAESGHVYSWGVPTHGRLGRDTSVAVPAHTPATIPGFSAMDISSGDGHCLAVSEEGVLFSWGAGFAGQLGLDKRGNMKQPTSVDVGEKVGQVSAGGSHSLCVGASGRVYSFGENEDGCLGTYESSLLKPKAVTGLPFVNRVAAFDRRSVVITEDGGAILLGFPSHETLSIDGVLAIAESCDEMCILKKDRVEVLDAHHNPIGGASLLG